MKVYLDNSATTKVLDSVKDIMIRTMEEDFGNPSSLHIKGIHAEQYIKESKSIIAKLLKIEEKEIIFTSGGTESNNLAIMGTALANKREGKHIISSVIEHPSVSNTLKHLVEEGFTVTYLAVDKDGRINPKDLEEAICEDTILVSIMYVNNEIGSIQKIEELTAITKKKNPKTLFHVDAIQAFGKIRIYPKRQGIDLLSVSGHKFHGPKGIGFLYIDNKVKINPLIFGGDQQRGVRSGTENVPGIAGIGIAAKEAYDNLEEKTQKLFDLKTNFAEAILKIEGTKINGIWERESAPHILSVSFEGIKSEVLLHTLEEKGIFVSSGSACASNKSRISPTLQGIGVTKELLDSALRFSFSYFTTKEELDYCIEVLEEVLPKLRKYSKR
ncbi:MAG: cysteine desulfurase [Clostridiales bacterium]|nr:cysteine desulfurase [Clostridiales bacterium]